MFGRNSPYTLSAFILLMAIPLGIMGGLASAVLALILAGASFLQARFIVDEIKKAQHECRRMDEQICRVEKTSVVDELSAGIAHEINNPLAIMAQEAQWIQRVFARDNLKGLKEVEECNDSLQEILLQIDRCREIVLKLLSLAKNMAPVIQSCDVNDLINEMSRIIERETAPKDIKIIKKLESNLPHIYSDPPLLRQVLLNLLMNASQAIDKGGEICIETETRGQDAIKISVTDNGCGISTEHMNRIFTPFFTTKSQGKGSGLGLAICRGIIERLGGSISVASESGTRTTFTIVLPINEPCTGEIHHAV